MDFTIENLAPDTDVVHMTFGDHPDSAVTVTVSREPNGEVHIYLVDNFDNSERLMVLGQEGYLKHPDIVNH